MAQSKGAKKRIRQTERRTAVNRTRLSRVRTYIKNVETAIDSGDKSAAETAIRAAEPVMMRGAQKGIFHPNTMARKLSRLTRRLKAMAA